MPSVIEFVDGNTRAVLRRVPFEDVPPANREVYLRGGFLVSSPDEADEVIPLARVVRLLVDDEGTPVDASLATRAVIQEFDAQGILRRETFQVRSR